MPYTNSPISRYADEETTSDGTYARFVNIDDEWHISLSPELAAIVRIGTTVTCDVETLAGKRYTRSGTVIRKQQLWDGTRRALCRIEEFRAGRANDERNTFALLPDGSWGVRLHVSASRNVRPGDRISIAVTAKSGRVTHVGTEITQILENEHGDRQAIGRIVERDDHREPQFDAEHGVTEPCPDCGTMLCDSGIVGRCTMSPESAARGELLPADQGRSSDHLESGLEYIAEAQDWDHWSSRIDRDEPIESLLGWHHRVAP